MLKQGYIFFKLSFELETPFLTWGDKPLVYLLSQYAGLPVPLTSGVLAVMILKFDRFQNILNFSFSETLE